MRRCQQNKIYLILMNVTVMHLERNNNNQHRYLENIYIGKDLGVVVGDEKCKSSHFEECNHHPRVYSVKRALSCDKKGVMSAALCSLGKAGAQHTFLSLTF